METSGEQLHPNWRALATVHIPLKRFVKEGSQQVQQGTQSSSNHKKYEIKNVEGKEIKEFYEELVKTEKIIKPKYLQQPSTSTKQKLQCQKKPFDKSKFHRCAMENQVTELKAMDLQNQDINVNDGYGWTALMMAACQGSLEAVIFLLELGADGNIKDKAGMTARDLARKNGHFLIEQILEKTIETVALCNRMTNNNKKTFEEFFCETCQETFSETSLQQHRTSTVHQFNTKSVPMATKFQKFNISPHNKGLQLMVKQGWDKESGLGPSSKGRLYPVKTVIRKLRTGLGIDQAPARVTHFQPYDQAAIKSQTSNHYRKKTKNRNDIRREKIVEWKRDRRLRNELS